MTMQFLAGKFVPASAPDRNALRDLLWSEAAEIPGLDPAIWRVDHLCRIMRYDDFGDETSAFGWTFSFVNPDHANALEARSVLTLAAVNVSSQLSRKACTRSRSFIPASPPRATQLDNVQYMLRRATEIETG